MNVRYLFVLCLLYSTITLAQTPAKLIWWNPKQSDINALEGQGWPAGVQAPYDRLPAEAEKTVPKAVWNLSRHSAGMMIRFRASTDQIVVRYQVKGNQSMPHMPATGVSGVDLYAGNSDGDWLWCMGKYTFGDTIQYRFTGLTPNDTYHQKGREYRLYLPLYTAVQWLEIGVPEGVTLTPLPVRIDPPIVIYGTSIAHGACASRPGMAWTSILGRKLDRPVINLGFSGNGRMEKEVVDFLPQLNARLFVLDCLPNLVSMVNTDAAEVHNRILNTVRTIRQKHPATPILLTDHAGYTDGEMIASRKKLYMDANEIQSRAYAQLKSEGVQNLYTLPISAINLDNDAMVDGTHPTDLGMVQYADAYERVIRQILKEPAGALSTTRPRTQYRDARIYDWEARHRDILTMNKTNPPRIAYIGNSITHFWGGEPKSPRADGVDSWQAVLDPLGVKNLGYGWDRIENVLWRVYHGELDGYPLQQAVLMIGTNNLQLNTNDEIVAGLKQLVDAIQVRQPQADILLVGILPRRNEEGRLVQLNSQIARLAGSVNATFAQPGTVFLKPDGKIDESLFSDGLHPNAEGYRRLAQALKPYLKPMPAPVVTPATSKRKR